jgi:hypothetical protein
MRKTQTLTQQSLYKNVEKELLKSRNSSYMRPGRYQHFKQRPTMRALYASISVILCRACNLTWFSPCLTGPVDKPVCFPSQGTQVQIPWGVLMWNRDSPVSVARYNIKDNTGPSHYTCVNRNKRLRQKKIKVSNVDLRTSVDENTFKTEGPIQSEELIALKCSRPNNPGFLGGDFPYLWITCSSWKCCYSGSTNH